MEAPWWCIRARFRPSRLTLATRFSISSALSSVDSFSSWMSLWKGIAELDNVFPDTCDVIIIVCVIFGFFRLAELILFDTYSLM